MSGITTCLSSLVRNLSFHLVDTKRECANAAARETRYARPGSHLNLDYVSQVSLYILVISRIMKGNDIKHDLGRDVGKIKHIMIIRSRSVSSRNTAAWPHTTYFPNSPRRLMYDPLPFHDRVDKSIPLWWTNAEVLVSTGLETDVRTSAQKSCVKLLVAFALYLQLYHS